MQQLIKITTDPIRIETFSQNARLVSSNSVDLERRKAIARSTALQKTAGQGSASIEHIRRINRTFSQSNVNTVTPKTENFQEQLISRQSQQPAPAPAKMPQVMQAQTPVISSDNGSSVVSAVSNATAATASSRDISAETRSSYTAQRGAFEMRVARGDLTYLPPLVMTVITQRPQVHVEYIGGFNYVPPRETDSGGNINLFT